ncbi:hypothetical protein [Azospirillum endophyticum]
MNKLFPAIIAGGIVLSAATIAIAQETGADLGQRFPQLLSEARGKVPSTSEVGTISTTLSTAEWYWNRGDRVQAVSYLNFARGRLGLSLIQPVVPAGGEAAVPAGRTP